MVHCHGMAALIEFQLPILVLPSLRPLRVSNVTNCFPLPAAKVPLSAWGRVVPTSDMTTAHDLVLYMEHQPKIHADCTCRSLHGVDFLRTSRTRRPTPQSQPASAYRVRQPVGDGAAVEAGNNLSVVSGGGEGPGSSRISGPFVRLAGFRLWCLVASVIASSKL